jgi:Flp pilus assembly protein TadD
MAMARACLARAPEDADAWLVLGTCLGEAGEDEPALEALDRAVLLAPGRGDARANLAIVQRRLGRRAEALASYEAAATLDPGNDGAMHVAGAMLLEDGAAERAAGWLARAARVAPAKADHHRELGRALLRCGRPEDAVASHCRALALAPEDPAILCCLGVALIEAGRPADAVTSLRHGHAAAPGDALIRFNLASALLAVGDFAEGWPLYEARWVAKAAELGPRAFPAPLWRGEDLAGATLLLHAEQGHGDAIQFARYAPLAAARAGRVVVECYPALMRLFAGLGGGVELVPRGAPLPPHAAQAPLMSLPLAFGTTLETVPASAPYLRPDPGLVQAWDRRLGAKAGLEVGIVASGSPLHKGDALRSIPRSAFRALCGIEGVRLVSLDRPPPTDGIAALDPMGEAADFADTAAIMMRLDLVVTADTAAAHLAGALGRPVWTLLPHAADWRWMTGREDSPWYPTMRLVRQQRPGDWGEVMGRIAARLAAMAGGAAAFSPPPAPADV